MADEIEYEVPLAKCVQAAQSANAGLILNCIRYWYPKGKVRWHGKYCVAKSRRHLMRETGLSLDQVKRGLVRLRNRGLIETEIHLFWGRTINHFFLTDLGKSVTGAEEPEQESKIDDLKYV